mgnify:CR=1 FL=1
MWRLLCLALLLTGCSVNLPQDKLPPEVEYVSQRLPVYDVPSRPWLEDITGPELSGMPLVGREKLVKNFDLLMRWGEQLQELVEGYNRYAQNHNAQNKLYAKIK